MSQEQKDFCFCTLALGKKYRLLAQQLAKDLEENSPGTSIVIYTDEPEDFKSYGNTLAYKHQQQGILLCYHDKRFVLAKALSIFHAAIYIDADTRILSRVSDNVDWQPGITAGHWENLIEHISKYSPERLEPLKKVASKLNFPLENTKYIGESLFVIARDEGRESKFFEQWGMIGRYLELKGVHSGEGNAMGLAAAQVGWTVKQEGWQVIKQAVNHIGASMAYTQETYWDKWKMRLGYHYRLNLARLAALKDYDFFYK
ncbi:hypothetical protein SAMD00079811_58480 [Scytonema sp. HK-05]|uniref:hypothetical protein n=1 Tax=Scytonema sp. HK-05 TaxID=1137095 RepID=UPI000937BC8C|nr:hypothetical protein [Scytonema sp. HK-05]OKH53449.1 hypothetical protein NIES2130_30315 [Scytonema sp. HK-05]BAY48227.1 hypothetical protein SAMD00079811_58480 [Scytonema sp. HK-05]